METRQVEVVATVFEPHEYVFIGIIDEFNFEVTSWLISSFVFLIAAPAHLVLKSQRQKVISFI